MTKTDALAAELRAQLERRAAELRRELNRELYLSVEPLLVLPPVTFARRCRLRACAVGFYLRRVWAALCGRPCEECTVDY